MTKPFVLIGLTGLSNTGKDTVADLLVTHQGFIKLSFAEALYAEVAEAYGVDISFLTCRETKEHPLTALSLARCGSLSFVGRMVLHAEASGQVLDLQAPRSPRWTLERWGTEYRRQQSKSYWVSKVNQRITYSTSNRLAHRFVVTDCRFADEVAMVRAFGGQIWQTKRNTVATKPGSHISATTGDAFAPNAVINNDHDIRHLQQLVLREFWEHDAGLEPGSLQLSITA